MRWLMQVAVTDVKDPKKALSMGFGFVTFYRPEDAQQALKEMQVCKMIKIQS